MTNTINSNDVGGNATRTEAACGDATCAVTTVTSWIADTNAMTGGVPAHDHGDVGRGTDPASQDDAPDVVDDAPGVLGGGLGTSQTAHASGIADASETAEAEAADAAAVAASARSARVADAAGRFATIRVSYGPQNLLVASLDELRMTALSIRENRVSTGRRIPMPAMRTIAELGVGKTWAAEKLVGRCAVTDADDKRRPVLLVELDTSGKQVSLPRGVLRTLSKRGWNIGNDPEVLWTRAIDAMKEFGVEIVIFDEINRAARRPSIGPVIGGDIMDLLVNGDVAVAFLGTEEADKVFDRCPPLKDRMKASAIMKALDWLLDEKETFITFLSRMDAALAANRLTDGISGIDDERIAKPLWDVSRGRLRPLCLLLEEAVTAIHREGGDGPRILTPDILAQAVEDLSLPAGVVDYNPFTEKKPA